MKYREIYDEALTKDLPPGSQRNKEEAIKWMAEEIKRLRRQIYILESELTKLKIKNNINS